MEEGNVSSCMIAYVLSYSNRVLYRHVLQECNKLKLQNIFSTKLINWIVCILVYFNNHFPHIHTSLSHITSIEMLAYT